ncbi:MAG: D-cysteine desulfhydrase family protein [Anaerolineales bacterium]|nr:D-cysteine desulfhydrase family protein [Anaerolineales bacterium]
MPRARLAHLPTPLAPLPRLSAALGGPRLWVKRDDLTGLAAGGNKTRKLEFLVGAALAQGADMLLTAGAAQSNHCAQTAAAAARHGLRCGLVLRGTPPAALSGNLILDTLYGAELIWAGDRPREAVLAEAEAAARAAGHRPYAFPIGGSTPVGATGYVLAMAELAEQSAALGVTFDRIVFASSSGGTHAGLVVGASLTGFAGQVLGVSIDHGAGELQAHVADLATRTARLLGRADTYAPAHVSANSDYLGGGYAVIGDAEREALRLFAQTDGLVLDPVYTGRAAAALIGLARPGAFAPTENVLFWHTGGTAALYAYGAETLGN